MEPAVRVDELEPWLRDALRVQIANADKAIVKCDVPAGKEEACKTAVANCPVQCIKLE